MIIGLLWYSYQQKTLQVNYRYNMFCSSVDPDGILQIYRYYKFIEGH